MSQMYSNFADVYDELMDNIPYDEWFSYLHELLISKGLSSGIIAELGCGTGQITERMASHGYDMIGIDNSISMLDIANEKKAENNSSALYLCQDMREFELYGTVAAVISICDSINYITDPDDLLQVFKLVENYLDPNGYFIFDFHTKYYYQDVVADSTIAEDRNDISFIWDNYYDEDSCINELALSLFIKEPDSELFRKHEELHYQRGYTIDEITTLIENAGLSLENIYDAFTFEKATDESERVYIIAKERGNNPNKKILTNNQGE